MKVAEFSRCRKWRYTLVRERYPLMRHRTLIAIMLNPSTADETQDDPTVRRVQEFAMSKWECGRAVVLNLFAFRATDPKVMRAAPNPVGSQNDRWIAELCEQARQEGNPVLVAWGRHGLFQDRANAVRHLIEPARPWCLGINQDGTPKHPLYIPNKVVPVRYQWPTS